MTLYKKKDIKYIPELPIFIGQYSVVLIDKRIYFIPIDSVAIYIIGNSGEIFYSGKHPPIWSTKTNAITAKALDILMNRITSYSLSPLVPSRSVPSVFYVEKYGRMGITISEYTENESGRKGTSLLYSDVYENDIDSILQCDSYCKVEDTLCILAYKATKINTKGLGSIFFLVFWSTLTKRPIKVVDTNYKNVDNREHIYYHDGIIYITFDRFILPAYKLIEGTWIEHNLSARIIHMFSYGRYLYCSMADRRIYRINNGGERNMSMEEMLDIGTLPFSDAKRIRGVDFETTDGINIIMKLIIPDPTNDQFGNVKYEENHSKLLFYNTVKEQLGIYELKVIEQQIKDKLGSQSVDISAFEVKEIGYDDSGYSVGKQGATYYMYGVSNITQFNSDHWIAELIVEQNNIDIGLVYTIASAGEYPIFFLPQQVSAGVINVLRTNGG